MADYVNGKYISRFAFWNPATWSIPSLYWDTMSQEQRYHAICRQLSKIIQYADYLGVNVDDIAGRLEAIEKGQLDDFIKAEIEQWFEDNEPAIVQAITDLGNAMNYVYDAIPMSDFDSENTVKDYIDAKFPIDTADITDGAVTNAKIAAGAVDTANIADDAITNAKIAAGAVDTANIADDAITSAKIAAGAVDTADIADDAVTSAKIAAGAVNTADIADDAVTTAKIADGSITIDKIAADALTFDNFSDSDKATIKSKSLKNHNILCFGDSLTNGAFTTHYWPYYLDTVFGAQTWNFGMSGQGFINNDNGTFQTQLQNAINSSAFDNDEITDIIVIGGFNDYAANDSDLSSAVATFVSTAKSNFVNANVYVGAMLCGVYPLDYAIGGASESQRRSKKISVIEFAARYNGANIITAPWTWLKGEMSWNIDNIHVNDDGERFIACCIADCLCGVSPIPFKQAHVTSSPSAVVSEIDVFIFEQNAMTTIEGHIKTTGNINGDTFMVLPEWAYFSTHGSFVLAIPCNSDVPANTPLMACNGTNVICYNTQNNQNIWFRASYPMGI